MIEKMKPVVLSIAGLDPSGGAGIVADIKTIAALGCFPAAALTSITYQNTTGVFGAEHQSAETLRAQVDPIDALLSDATETALRSTTPSATTTKSGVNRACWRRYLVIAQP